MGVTSILVIREMNQQANQLISLQEQTDIARQAIYTVTSQSHFRAMALITEDDSYNDKIAPRRRRSSPTSTRWPRWADRGPSHRRERSIKSATRPRAPRCWRCTSRRAPRRARPPHLRRARDLPRARGRAEPLIDSTEARIGGGLERVASLTASCCAVAIFSGMSLLTRWVSGRPCPGRSSARCADGPCTGTDRRRRLRERIDVPNRDEFGRLTTNLNRTSGQLVDAVPRPRGS